MLLTMVQNPKCEFVVKEFSDSHAFKCERMMLDEFSHFPDDHIVLHIMTWSQSGNYYILYDKAKYSLRAFINRTERFVELEAPVVIWFLRQLLGLANAIKHVHNFSKKTRRTGFDLQDKREDEEDVDDYWGRHNDIKPENILVFEKIEHQNPMFKLTDFGQGNFRDARGKIASEKDSRARGTRAYWAPETSKGLLVAKALDSAKEGKISRPIDMWALGCVFLELLLWLFGFYQDENDAGFSTDRAKFPGYNEFNRDDMFWYDDELRNPRLRPAVADVLHELKNSHCTDMRAFQNVITAIEKLLEPEPTKRMTAKELVEWMGTTTRQTEADLRVPGNKDLYRRQYSRNREESDISEISQEPEPLSERLDPKYSPTVSRAPSASSSRKPASFRDVPNLLHSTSAPPDLLHTGLAGTFNGSNQDPPERPFATDRHSVHEEPDELSREIDDLTTQPAPSAPLFP
jgi:serine/threonine protein kinase